MFKEVYVTNDPNRALAHRVNAHRVNVVSSSEPRFHLQLLPMYAMTTLLRGAPFSTS